MDQVQKCECDTGRAGGYFHAVVNCLRHVRFSDQCDETGGEQRYAGDAGPGEVRGTNRGGRWS